MSSNGEAQIDDRRLKEDPREEVWSNWQGAVLLRDEIEHYANLDPPLIKPFEKELLKSASYHLRVGSHCRVDGEDKYLSEQDPLLTIPSHASAIISTLEEFNIPGFLIGRWNLRVKKVYEGLVWTGSLQVDPGYYGNLFCPIFNLSTEPIKIEFREPLFTIDFVRTTRYDSTRGCQLWSARDKRTTTSLGMLDKGRLKSALSKFISETNRSIRGIEARQDRFQAVVLTVLAIVVAAVAVIATLGALGRFEDVHSLGWASLGVSSVAIGLAIWALCRSFVGPK